MTELKIVRQNTLQKGIVTELKTKWLNRLKVFSPAASYLFKAAEPVILLGILLLLWWRLPAMLQNADGTTGSIDQSIWILIILALISFLLVTALCWWLLQYSWQSLGLPEIQTMVSQFNTLALWQQLSFFWASLALLLGAAVCSLNAIL
ncbi:hypothetical protein [Pedobacter sp. MR2016-24]|uniref:hypothetical protein n=1 Tax=Pedobacter sp. MR2016-24 TaxID=2994466 RepID=UPI00224756EE|nr:hypothetical protein [Pedobacter sp. MR2016-24]MCX2483749.1 hypothetical protein [Pedobacter sp. MR2016-24]